MNAGRIHGFAIHATSLAEELSIPNDPGSLEDLRPALVFLQFNCSESPRVFTLKDFKDSVIPGACRAHRSSHLSVHVRSQKFYFTRINPPATETLAVASTAFRLEARCVAVMGLQARYGSGVSPSARKVCTRASQRVKVRWPLRHCQCVRFAKEGYCDIHAVLIVTSKHMNQPCREG
ncbi:uncharacterized protein MYCFIDRAFT_209835 [Pseudocercospora fijiensis CIRAD86]|uniref:Uncharacterized protein n=1 Tax=Pseudocercospora fijiensis (strain CIRAD86) TaxID=383855 RepID=N1QBJ5_PSEFD|nr:uncharacterized protein MYCFIDRAFT_209835 [Pseudocercospora fijiensis CIRAD86]EME88528.1 hypothetical protein MYCFIDRAFT_209835 [Pseudocercospora fijiensis CIRAD86]